MHWSIEKALETLKDIEGQTHRQIVGDHRKGTLETRLQIAILVTLTEILAELKAQRKTD
jgi:hypothetical protein